LSGCNAILVLRESIVAGMRMILGACLIGLALTGCVTQILRILSTWDHATDADCTTRYDLGRPARWFLRQLASSATCTTNVAQPGRPPRARARDSPRSIPG
jgi:hypothetical protein